MSRRLDRSHPALRMIEQIQHERDDYEKEWQEQRIREGRPLHPLAMDTPSEYTPTRPARRAAPVRFQPRMRSRPIFASRLTAAAPLTRRGGGAFTNARTRAAGMARVGRRVGTTTASQALGGGSRLSQGLRSRLQQQRIARAVGGRSGRATQLRPVLQARARLQKQQQPLRGGGGRQSAAMFSQGRRPAAATVGGGRRQRPMGRRQGGGGGMASSGHVVRRAPQQQQQPQHHVVRRVA